MRRSKADFSSRARMAAQSASSVDSDIESRRSWMACRGFPWGKASAKSDSLVALSGLSDGNSLPRDSGRQRLPLSSLASKLGTFVTGTMKSAPAYWMARLGISGANASPGFFDDTHVSANLDCNQSRGNRHPVGPRGLRQPLADHKRERLSETEDRWLAGDDFHSATGYTYAPCLEQQMLVGSCQANNPDFHGSPSAGCRAGHIAPSWPLRMPGRWL